MKVKEFIVNEVISIDPENLSWLDVATGVRYLNKVMTMVEAELKSFEPEVFRGYVQAKFIKGEFELPEDFDRNSTFMLFMGGFDDSPFPTSMRRIRNGKLVLRDKESASYVLRYTKNLNRFKNDGSEEFPFKSNKSIEKIASEIQSLAYKADDDWEDNNQANSSYKDSNRIT